MMAMSIVTEDKTYHDVERRPIDLVHLAKQTLGDRSLETEVLRLFMTQADVYMQRVEQANDDDARFAAAHTIKGSARNIGAWIVADAAADVETTIEAKITADIAALKEALRETCFFISGILEES